MTITGSMMTGLNNLQAAGDQSKSRGNNAGTTESYLGYAQRILITHDSGSAYGQEGKA